MSLTDKLVRHQIFLERFAGSVSRTMQQGINQARDIAIQAFIATGQVDVDLDRVETEIRAVLQASMDQALNNIKELNQYEGEFAARTLRAEVEQEIEEAANDILEAALLNKAMPVGTADKKTNRKIEPSYNKLAEENTKLFMSQVKEADRGEDALATAGGIAALAAGLLRFRAQSLSRASVVHASNTAKDETYKVNKDVVDKVEWVSVLDSRTTDFCRNQDNKRYPVGQGPRPPAHYNCRSITKPVVKGIDE